MIAVDEARRRILDGLRPTQPEIVALPDAWGRVLAVPVRARLTQPPADVSAMDGYAVRAADAAAKATLRVIGTAPAGHPFAGRLTAGEAVRLFTGSVVPDGADAVVIQEDTARDGDIVTVTEAARPGRHIRRAGQDFAAGDIVAAVGRRLGARDIGLIAAANHPWVAVHRRPVVAILATGDEISLPGDPIAPGGIVSSNSHAIAAMARAAGAVPMILPIARDTVADIAATADRLAGVDLLVTTGGASVGEHDLVQSALGARGMTLDFWKIAMRPGKPLIHGALAGLPLLGLPGNPVSAVVCALLFLLPALGRLAGGDGAALPTTSAILGNPVGANDQRADFLRSKLSIDPAGRLVAEPFPIQDSGMLAVLARADALVLRAPFAPATPAGATVEVLRLDNLGL